jgi:hypothetical protein
LVRGVIGTKRKEAFEKQGTREDARIEEGGRKIETVG